MAEHPLTAVISSLDLRGENKILLDRAICEEFSGAAVQDFHGENQNLVDRAVCESGTPVKDVDEENSALSQKKYDSCDRKQDVDEEKSAPALSHKKDDASARQDLDDDKSALPHQINDISAVGQEVDEEKSALSHQREDISAMIQALEDGLIPLELLDAGVRSCDSVSDLTFPIHLLGMKYNNLRSEFETMRKKYNENIDKYTELWVDRKRLFNEVLETKGNVRVFCRCRPMNLEEHSRGYSSVFEFDPLHETELQIVTSESNKKHFKFDHVFGPQGTQEAVFGETKSLVTSILDGYNVCIFAYGQTGTGKTFTMEGIPENRGVNYRTLEELFRVSGERNHLMKYEFFISALEVYNEQIRDLLPGNASCPSKKLEVKQTAEGTQEVPGLAEIQTCSIDGVWEVLQAGARNRSVGSTNANELSSRSHSLVRVTVKGENVINGVRTRSHLWLVDLAGSERLTKIEVDGERLKESQFINKSLSALGDVISAMAAKSPHVPYRNSKLTHLLQSSLGGDCKTLMIVQVSPSSADVGETLCSLNFATRVRGIEKGPARKQADPAETFRLKQMAETLRLTEKDRARLNESLQLMHSKYAAKESQVVQLKEKVKDLENQVAQERKSKQPRQEETSERFHPSKPPLHPQRPPLARISANVLPVATPQARKIAGNWLPIAPKVATVGDEKENNKPKMQARRIPVPSMSRMAPAVGGLPQLQRRASVAATPSRIALNRSEAQAPSSILRIIRRRSSVMALRNVDISCTPPRQGQDQGRWRPSRIPVLQSPCEGAKIGFRIQKRIVVGSPMRKRSLAPSTIPTPSAGRFGLAQRIPNHGNRRRSVL